LIRLFGNITIEIAQKAEKNQDFLLFGEENGGFFCNFAHLFRQIDGFYFRGNKERNESKHEVFAVLCALYLQTKKGAVRPFLFQGNMLISSILDTVSSTLPRKRIRC
jgi:hypothetical protein